MRQTTPLMAAASRLGTSAANGAEVVATLLAAGAKVNADEDPRYSTASRGRRRVRCIVGNVLRCDDCADAQDLNKWSAAFHAAWVARPNASSCCWPTACRGCSRPLAAYALVLGGAAVRLDVARCLLGAGATRADRAAGRLPRALSQLEWSTPLHPLHDWNSRNTDVTDDADGSASTHHNSRRLSCTTTRPAWARLNSYDCSWTPWRILGTGSKRSNRTRDRTRRRGKGCTKCDRVARRVQYWAGRTRLKSDFVARAHRAAAVRRA